jgi:hypothetical protein
VIKGTTTKAKTLLICQYSLWQQQNIQKCFVVVVVGLA